jgi:AcrR family transcriptional regulator
MAGPAIKKIAPVVVNRASARTRKKILGASIDLFNKQGIQNVTTEKIALKIGISPGNLTYHFKRKQDLVIATLTVLEERMRAALSPPTATKTPQYGAAYLIGILHTFWEFRFFFNALTYLLSKDEELREEYFHFHDWALDTVERGLQEMMRNGDLRVIREPNNTRLLAENMWFQWLSWLRMQQIRSPSATLPEGEAVYDCALHHWSLLEPYFSEQYARDLLPAYRTLLLKKKSSAKTGSVAKSAAKSIVKSAAKAAAKHKSAS